jgi:octopine/nopaline transport system substrate-binding protein
MNMTGLALGLLAVLLAHTASAEDMKPLRIATEGAFPPWNAVDTAGQPVGFDIDVGRAVCERAKLTCTFVTQAWDGIIPGLVVGKYDAVMAGMSITEKRKQVIAFSEPYALTSNYFVVQKSASLPVLDTAARIDLSAETADGKRMLDALKTAMKGKAIGVQGSTNAEAFVRQYFGGEADIRTYDKQDNLNLDLLAGRIDAGLADFSVLKAFLDSKEGQGSMLYGPRISGGLFGPGVGIGLRKDEADRKAALDAAIRSITADGTLKALSMKWFGADLVSR